MLRTCSRPPGELLKMRTLPDSTTNRPAHGSPSLNTISPAEYLREETRSSRNSNSRSESPENNCVLLKALARLCWLSGTAGIVQKWCACGDSPETVEGVYPYGSEALAASFGFQDFADLHCEQIQLKGLLQQRGLAVPFDLSFRNDFAFRVTRHEDDLNLGA